MSLYKTYKALNKIRKLRELALKNEKADKIISVEAEIDNQIKLEKLNKDVAKTWSFKGFLKELFCLNKE